MMLPTTLNAEQVIVQGQKGLGITSLHTVISQSLSSHYLCTQLNNCLNDPQVLIGNDICLRAVIINPALALLSSSILYPIFVDVGK